MTKDSTAIQQEIIKEFSVLVDWSDRYQYIIDLGKQLESFPEQYRDEAHFVRGCQSQVWLQGDLTSEKRLKFVATSDSAIVRGLIALLFRVYNDHTPQEILSIEPFFIREIGLEQHLSPTRRNGLFALLKHIRQLAQTT